MQCHCMSTLAWGKFDIRAQLGRRWDSQNTFSRLSPVAIGSLDAHHCWDPTEVFWPTTHSPICIHLWLGYISWIWEIKTSLIIKKKNVDLGLERTSQVRLLFCFKNRYSLFAVETWVYQVAGLFLGNVLGKTQRDPTARISKATAFAGQPTLAMRIFLLLACERSLPV